MFGQIRAGIGRSKWALNVSNGTIYVSMYVNSTNYIFLNVEDGSKNYMNYEHKTSCGFLVEFLNRGLRS